MGKLYGLKTAPITRAGTISTTTTGSSYMTDPIYTPVVPPMEEHDVVPIGVVVSIDECEITNHGIGQMTEYVKIKAARMIADELCRAGSGALHVEREYDVEAQKHNFAVRVNVLKRSV